MLRRLVLAVVLLATTGCANPPVDVAAHPRAAFPHGRHLEYFASGTHRQEKIGMHLAAFGDTDVPEDLSQGKCTECHDDLAEMTACAGCHVIFQDAGLRARKDARRCVACHRGAWAGTAASLPRTDACTACHRDRESLEPGAPTYTAARLDTGPAAYAGGVRASVMPQNVYFSHRAHVRFGEMSCVRCHADPRGAAVPPVKVRAVSMYQCLKCHVENGASTDCLTCHK
jgi:hypothetical protein